VQGPLEVLVVAGSVGLVSKSVRMATAVKPGSRPWRRMACRRSSRTARRQLIADYAARRPRRSTTTVSGRASRGTAASRRTRLPLPSLLRASRAPWPSPDPLLSKIRAARWTSDSPGIVSVFGHSRPVA
jgi:hypothetical protein